MGFSLRRYESGSDGDGEDGVPGRPPSAGKRAVQLVRIERIVELLMTTKRPQIEGLEKELGCSRATLYRDLASVDFHRALEDAVNAQFAARVPAALDLLMRALEADDVPWRDKIKLAQWLVDRFDRLRAAMGKAAEPEDEDDGAELVARLRAELEGTALDGSRVELQDGDAADDDIGPKRAGESDHDFGQRLRRQLEGSGEDEERERQPNGVRPMVSPNASELPAAEVETEDRRALDTALSTGVLSPADLDAELSRRGVAYPIPPPVRKIAPDLPTTEDAEEPDRVERDYYDTGGPPLRNVVYRQRPT